MNLLENLATYLVAQGLVKQPGAVGAPPPLYIDPRDGVPAPAAVAPATDAVLGAFVTGGIPARVREAELRKDVVDIWIRTKTSPRAHAIEEQIRAVLIDKMDWQMGAMHISETLQWRPLQRFESNADGYTYLTAYIFERRAF